MLDTVSNWLGAFLGVAAVGFLGEQLSLQGVNSIFLIGSFGATAVLVYAVPSAPLSQPRNVLIGHVLSALVGVAVYQWATGPLWFLSALAVASAVAMMSLTNCVHPPGGATALIAVLGDAQLHRLGYWYAITPVALGALLMLSVAWVTNRLSGRRYPMSWW